MDDWNAWAVPWKLVVIDAGSLPSSSYLAQISAGLPASNTGANFRSAS